MRRILPLLVLLTLAVAGCADGASAPSPSALPQTPVPSAAPSTPTASPAPLVRGEVPINCLNVLAADLRGEILALGSLEMLAFSGRVGEATNVASTGDGFEQPPATRQVGCFLGAAEQAVEIGYSEFDPAATETLLADMTAWADLGEAYQPPGTDLALVPDPGISGAQRLQIPFEDGSAKTWIVGDGWILYVHPPWTSTGAVAADLPDEELDADAVGASIPVDQACESVLPVPTPTTDLMAQLGLSSSSTVVSGPDTVICHANEASAYERVLWWEEVDAASREQLLADAAAEVDGMRAQGSTDDGSGAIVALADDTRLVVFDEHIVHVEIPVDGERALQLSRQIHAPAWLDVPPVA